MQHIGLVSDVIIKTVGGSKILENSLDGTAALSRPTAWTNDGRYFVCLPSASIVKIVECNVPTEKPYDGGFSLNIAAGKAILSLAITSFSEQGKEKHWHLRNTNIHVIVAAGLSSGRIRTWNALSGQLLHELIDHKVLVSSLQFSVDNSLLLISSSHDGFVKVWNLKDDGNMHPSLNAGIKQLYCCAWSSDRSMIAAGGLSKIVIVWETTQYKIIARLRGHRNAISACKFSPDNSLLATASFDTKIILWNPQNGEKLSQFLHLVPEPSLVYAGGANGVYVRDVCFSPCGLYMASVADDNSVRFWDVFDADAECLSFNIEGPLSCRFSPNGHFLSVGSCDRSFCLLSTPQRVASLRYLARLKLRQNYSAAALTKLSVPNFLKKIITSHDLYT